MKKLLLISAAFLLLAGCADSGQSIYCYENKLIAIQKTSFNKKDFFVCRMD